MTDLPPLLEKLAREIDMTGPMRVDQFMAMAMTDPDYGYYSTGAPIGADGDFITAPEISQMFGELLGLWAVDTWQRLGCPDPFYLVELGPGRGTLMVDALRAAGAVRPFMTAMRLHMIEASGPMRVMQSTKIAHTIEHHYSLDEVPTDAPLILIANEFLDALPIRQFQKTGRGWCERLVGLDRKPTLPGLPKPDAPSLCFALLNEPINDPIGQLGARVRGALPGAIAETCPGGETLVEALSHRLIAQGGAALFIDYGPAQSGLGDTLQALKDHQFCNVLTTPGQADLTAHVDFDRLARIANKAGAQAYPIATQGAFLEELGISYRANSLKKTGRAADIETARKRLVDTDQMGELFKVLGLSAPGLPGLAGLPMNTDGLS